MNTRTSTVDTVATVTPYATRRRRTACAIRLTAVALLAGLTGTLIASCSVPSSVDTGRLGASACEVSARRHDLLPTPRGLPAISVGHIRVPASPSRYGPLMQNGHGFVACFSHSRPGAAYAAAFSLAYIAEPSYLVGHTGDIAANGGTRDVLTRLQGRTGPSVVMALRGFRILDYSENRVRTLIALQAAPNELLAFPVELQWTRHDWHVNLVSPNATEFEPLPLDSTTGYGPWPTAAQ